jgi:hypothetical protein
MQLKITRANTLIALLLLVLDCPSLFGAPVIINYTDRGWYRSSGGHLTNNLNYFVGDNLSNKDTRNFFVFDLAGVTQPIASAKLALYVPGAPSDAGPGFASPDGKEAYELHDVITPISTLVNGTGGVSAHTDLGSGVVYGIRSMSAADNGSVVEITLNPSAIAAMNATHGLFGLGGSITSLDDLTNNEYVFAYTEDPANATQLRLTLVPEPSSGFLCLAAIVATQLRRQRTASRNRVSSTNHARSIRTTLGRLAFIAS